MGHAPVFGVLNKTQEVSPETPPSQGLISFTHISFTYFHTLCIEISRGWFRLFSSMFERLIHAVERSCRRFVFSAA